jgi:putative ABC transport system permease protein
MLWKLLTRGRRARDLDDELQYFVDELTARHLARGLAPDEARRAALVEVGGVQQVREATRDVWRIAPLETLARDLRYGARMVRRSPGFTLVVGLTLGLVIGANATVFGVMHAVLWRSLPYPDADRLVLIESELQTGGRHAGIADAESLDIRAEPGLFERIGNAATVDAHVNVDGDMERVPAASVSDDVLPMLGAEPMALGRALESAIDGGVDSTVRAVVISHELWVRRFARDPRVIGRHIEVNNLDVEVVGVLRPGFRLYVPVMAGAPEVIDVWFPRGFENDRRVRFQTTVAKLAAGSTIRDARTRLDLIARRTAAAHPASYPNGSLRFFADPLQERLTAGVRQPLWVLGGAVAFVLLIGCVNVATLMLARARSRQPEMALRRALGAGRFRIARQLLAEAAILGFIGAALGLAVTYAGIELVDWLRPAHLPRQASVRVTAEVVAFVAVLAVAVILIVGLVPAFISSEGAAAALRVGRSAVQRAGTRRVQRALVVAEVALSIVPLVAAGLMLRTFVNMTGEPLGFDPANVVTAKVAFSFRQFPDAGSRVRLLGEAIDRVRQLPGVQDVAIGGPLPLDGLPQTATYAIASAPGITLPTTLQSVFPGYLRVTRTPLLAGRELTDDDVVRQQNVAIVDERIAERHWPEGALGRRIVLSRMRNSVELEIVGVSRAVRATSVRHEPLPHVFVPYHVWAIGPSLVVRTPLSAAAIGPDIKRVVESLGTRRPVFDILPMQEFVDRSVQDTRFVMLVLTGFATAALLLTAIGLYGTLAYLTALRAQEFGVRMALGATTSRILRSVAHEGLGMAAAGAALGVVGAVWVSGLLQGLLYDVTPLDGVTLTGVVLVVGVVALGAVLHPAWRAARTNPMRVLRAGE